MKANNSKVIKEVRKNYVEPFLQLLKDNLKEIKNSLNENQMTRNPHALKEVEIKLALIDLENQGIVSCSGKKSNFRQGPILNAAQAGNTELVHDIHVNVCFNQNGDPIYQKKQKQKRNKKKKNNSNGNSKETKDIDRSKEKDFPCLVCKQNTHWTLLGWAQLKGHMRKGHSVPNNIYYVCLNSSWTVPVKCSHVVSTPEFKKYVSHQSKCHILFCKNVEHTMTGTET